MNRLTHSITMIIGHQKLSYGISQVFFNAYQFFLWQCPVKWSFLKSTKTSQAMIELGKIYIMQPPFVWLSTVRLASSDMWHFITRTYRETFSLTSDHRSQMTSSHLASSFRLHAVFLSPFFHVGHLSIHCFKRAKFIITRKSHHTSQNHATSH